MKVTGSMTCSTDSEKRSGMMNLNTLATTTKAKSTVKVSTFGRVAPATMETGMKIEFMDLANILGLTAESITENGKIITWMEKEFTLQTS